MNCHQVEPLLFAERDGALSPAQRASLAQHIAGCAACRQLHGEFATALAAWQADVTQVAVPNAATAWTALRPRLAEPQPAHRRKLAPIIWLTAPLAAAAAIALVFLTATHGPLAPTEVTDARAEFVQPGNANASTMVYVDKDSGWLVVWAADTTNNGKG